MKWLVDMLVRLLLVAPTRGEAMVLVVVILAVLLVAGCGVQLPAPGQQVAKCVWSSSTLGCSLERESPDQPMIPAPATSSLPQGLPAEQGSDDYAQYPK